MNNNVKNNKVRFGVFDAVIIIVVLAIAAALVFRYTTDKKLFEFDLEEYTVTFKACGLEYTTIDMIGSSDSVYLSNGEYLGTLKNAPTVTPMLKYSLTSSGDIITAYYPDNTLVDISSEINCELIKSDGLLMTKDGIRIATGVILEIHTPTVDLTVEITGVEKAISN